VYADIVGGGLAVHPSWGRYDGRDKPLVLSYKHWQVTHIVSGLSLTGHEPFRYRTQAVKYAELIAGSGVDCTLDGEEFYNALKAFAESQGTTVQEWRYSLERQAKSRQTRVVTIVGMVTQLGGIAQ
jgi:hypothetical protein